MIKLSSYLNLQIISFIMSNQIFQRPLIAFDNSQNNEKVLEVFDGIRSKTQSSLMFHVYDPRRTFMLLPSTKPQIEKVLNEKYPKEEETLPPVAIQLKQKEDKTINQNILEKFISSKSTILFLGFVGSKGPKVRNCDLSSRVREFVYDSKIQLAIIKKASTGTGSIIFCCDGSEVSLNGLAKAVQVSKKLQKKLTILHVTTPLLSKHSKRVKTRIKNSIDSEKDLKAQIIIQQTDLIGYLSEHQSQYQWVVVNKNGFRGEISKKRFVGSSTSKILEQVDANLIILS